MKHDYWKWPRNSLLLRFVSILLPVCLFVSAAMLFCCSSAQNNCSLSKNEKTLLQSPLRRCLLIRCYAAWLPVSDRMRTTFSQNDMRANSLKSLIRPSGTEKLCDKGYRGLEWIHGTGMPKISWRTYPFRVNSASNAWKAASLKLDLRSDAMLFPGRSEKRVTAD